jgi:hypothetical protein
MATCPEAIVVGALRGRSPARESSGEPGTVAFGAGVVQTRIMIGEGSLTVRRVSRSRQPGVAIRIATVMTNAMQNDNATISRRLIGASALRFLAR